MKKQTLNGLWTLKTPNESLSATVPGSVYSALLDAEKMPDPFRRDNELSALKLMDDDYTFEREFDVELPDGERLLLRCEGLDTICEISLNGKNVGKADNMHRTWEFDITDAARERNNRLSVTFKSPTRYIAAAYRACRADGSTEAMRGYPHIRKAHCMFGWDWGPRLPDMGIWRDISLVRTDAQDIKDVRITQRHVDGKVELTFAVQCGAPVEIEVVSPDGEVFRSDGKTAITIPNPKLWFPNGYGGQPLYSVRVTSPSDCWERRIGLRTVRVNREKDEWGEAFAFEVNGLPIFAMGANYIPQDNILSRVTRERTYALLKDCVAANFNFIRVWGGGYYPEDFFYDICDELGLLVWQDFMFACAAFELTPDFEANIRAEVGDNVKRLRHHASLGLWCGNNEMEWQIGGGSFNPTPKQKADYIRIFEYIIPQVVRENDTETFYHPSSPSCGGGFDDPGDPDRGNMHYWDVWHGGKPFSEYRKFHFRFTTEFGFQSFPELKTVKSFTEEGDRNIFSRIMEMHQRNANANGKIMTYMAGSYRYPESFEHVLYASQLLQAESIRYAVEHWRRNRGRCMGSIYWQLNDIWPTASWASIDYFGRWKALHYLARRFYAPVMISACETGEMTERPSCVAQPEPIKKSAAIAIANETANPVSGVVRWALRTPSAEILKSGEKPVKADAYSSLWLEEMDFSDCDELSHYLSYEFETGGKMISSGSVMFCMPKHFNFVDPGLKVERDGRTITVTAKAYVKNVELYSDEDDFILSDNYFDMNAGSVRVEIERGDVRDMKVRSVYDLGR